jgi:hypothetical protein
MPSSSAIHAQNTPTLGKSMSCDGSPINEHKSSKIERTSNSPTGVWDKINLDNNNDYYDIRAVVEDDDDDCQTIMSQKDLAPIPERLIDFFCIVGPKLDKIRHFAETPADVHLQPTLLDCYPKDRSDVTFPVEIPMFVLPHKCQLTTPYDHLHHPPTLSTFVLTTGNGNRLYGTALTHYELIPLEDLATAFWKGKCVLPSWLEDPQPFYLPKCLVVFSHHAFLDVQRNFLIQLHRILESGISPLPLERFIANFCHDVPLPKPGAATISWKPFTQDAPVVNYQRPAANQLPLVNVSYKPLLRCLSVPNILTIWGILLREGRVVLRSEHIALLTPVAEALISLFFPMKWQGVYVPVLPTTMMDVLEAPVPFLIGLLVSTNSCPQPEGVVVCDLDQDIIHLGTETLPKLPEDLVATLKKELDDVADPLFLIPPSGVKGRITKDPEGLLENTERELFAHMFQLRNVSLTNTHREYILTHANYVPQDLERLTENDFILGPDEEQTLYKSIDKKNKNKNTAAASGGGNFMIKALRRQGRAIQAHTDRAISFTQAGSARYDEEMEKKKKSIAQSMYDIDEDLADTIRHSFLRFFSSLFGKYKEFCQPQTNYGSPFRHVDFVNSWEDEMSYESRLFVLDVIRTQMFERFLVESSTRRRLFDEYILVHQNNSSILGKKRDTPFLNRNDQTVRKIIVPAAPCTVGIPRGAKYEYDSQHFSKLKKEELIANKTLDPVSALCYLGDLMLCGVGSDW